MKLPLILVNFKVYEQSTGENAVDLAKICEEVAHETGVSIAIAVSALDLQKVASSVSIPVFAQHIDPVTYGSYTGRITPDLVKECGAYGTLLNHAEYQIENETIMKSVEMAKAAGLFTIVCAETPDRARQILKYNPDLIAIEPPELIGGNISVSKAEPEVIEKSVKLIGENRVLVGAGVKTGEDVKIAIALGASGVLLASGIVKSKDPYSVLMDLVSGLK
jgi:triosephosphate isomerase